MTDEELQLEMWSLEVAQRTYEESATGKQAADPNPCVRIFGFGPEGVTCKLCDALYYHQRSKRYYKCRFRSFSFGPATDHRVRWNACGVYRRKIEEYAPEVLN